MDAISNIGQLFNGPLGKVLQLAMGGAGTIGNILAGNKRNQVLNQSLTNQADLMKLAGDPSAVAANAAKLQQPLSAGLTSGVGNAVQGYLAERGLSQAPGIASETLAQGLAPYQLQEQQMALNSYLQSLGLPAQATPRFLPYPQSTDLSKLFQSLFSKPDPLSSNMGSPSPTPGISGQPTTQQLLATSANNFNPGEPSTNNNFGQLTPPSDNGAFNWMDLLSPNSNGMTFATS